MIVGNYYINNFLVLGLVLAVAGGVGYIADVPGMLDGDSSQERPSMEYDISLLGGSTESGSSQVIRFVRSNGSTVSGAEVFVNGEEVGVTGESGELAFEVPDSQNMTVSASKSGVEVTRTFDVEDSQQDEGDSGGEDADEGGQDSGDDSEENSDNQQEKNETTRDNSTEQDNETAGDNETFQPTFIEKVSPENSELQSRSFELILELGANNSNYQVSLGGEQKLSGQIDGNQTVTSTLEVPRNGTVGLQVEILKNNEVRASENYSLTYNSDSSGDDGGDNGSEVENDVTAGLSVTDNVNVGDQFTLDASGSTGEIENYTWEFGDGSSEVTQSSETSHSYSSEGDYSIVLTVEGPNGSEDSTTATVTAQTDSQSSTTPEINFVSPVDGFETDQSSLGYEFDVENASGSSTYSILIDGSGVSSGGLDEGTNSVQETVSIPSEVFNTSIEVEQDGEIYSSGKRTVNATGASAVEPEFTLDNPGAGEVVETLDTQTSVSFEYEVISREWARQATLEVSNESGMIVERPVSVSEGNHTEEVNNLATGNYTYTVALSDGNNQVSKSNDFEIRQVEPEYTVTQETPLGTNSSPEMIGKYQDILANVSFKTDTNGELYFQVRAAESGSNTYQAGGESVTESYEKNEVVYEDYKNILADMDYHEEFRKDYYVAIKYKWRAWINNTDGEKKALTGYQYFETTEEP